MRLIVSLPFTRFEVEKQFGAGNGQWAKIGMQAAVGSGANGYSYIDVDKMSGTVLYRLKMVDNDGRYTYSNIIKLFEKAPMIKSTVYPNPIGSIATLGIGDLALLNSKAALINAQVEIMMMLLIQHRFELLDISGLPQGAYFLKLSNGEYIKMIKQ